MIKEMVDVNVTRENVSGVIDDIYNAKKEMIEISISVGKRLIFTQNDFGFYDIMNNARLHEDYVVLAIINGINLEVPVRCACRTRDTRFYEIYGLINAIGRDCVDEVSISGYSEKCSDWCTYTYASDGHFTFYNTDEEEEDAIKAKDLADLLLALRVDYANKKVDISAKFSK